MPINLHICDVFGRKREITVEQLTLIGTDPMSAICLDDPAVSRFHALLIPTDETLWCFDLNSTNGTWQDGSRLKHPALLRTGDILRIGRTTFLMVS